MKLMKFLINFLKALIAFIGYGVSVYLILEFLKLYNPSPWVLAGLLVVCICVLAAFLTCHLEEHE